MQRVAVVILNWNGQHFLEKFLGSVVDCSRGASVVVVDNCSTDGSVEWIATNHPKVERVILDKNYGFAGGYNKGLEAVRAEYYILLNSDVQVTPDWIEPMLSLMDSDAQIAAIQPKILSYSYNDFFEYAGASGGFIDTLGYPFCRGRLIGECEQDRGQYDDVREIFWATGAAFMVRAEDFRRSGGFDEIFFAHQEEIDLCWRLKRQGRKIMVAPQSVVYHVGAGTLPIWSPRKTYLNFRNNIAMLYKNLPMWRFAVVYCCRVGTDMLRALSYLATLKFSFASAIYRGHRDFWRFRRKLNRHDEFARTMVGQIYRGSIVLHYIFVNKCFGNKLL